MKPFITYCLIIFSTIIYGQAEKFYAHQTIDIEGNMFNFSELKGKKVMIVNTASKCGFTYQYEQLEEIYKKYKDNNFMIIGFPSNDFSNQEPGSNKEIANFCKVNFGVTFPIMSKIHVTGKDKAAIYQFLTNKSENGVMDSKVKWNFHKFLIDENGKLSQSLNSKVEPNSSEIIRWIENKK